MTTVFISVHGGKACRECKWTETDLLSTGPSYINNRADRTVIAIDECGHLAGVWRYNIFKDTIRSVGTWVRSKYRKNGLAKRLWEEGLKADRPQKSFCNGYIR